MDIENKNNGLHKLAFLLILMLSIGVAALLVTLRSNASMTSPIMLKNVNLAASVPVENGWESKKNWAFMDGGYTLNSIFRRKTKKISALAQCKYSITQIDKPSQVQIDQKALSLKDKILKQGQIISNELDFDWAMIGNHTFYAISKLDNNRIIEVEIQQVDNETEWARDIFLKMIKSIKYDNASIDSATQLVSDLKKIGVSNFISKNNQKDFFLIRDQEKNPIGFTMETYLKSDVAVPLGLRSATFFYLRGVLPNNQIPNEQITFFQGSETLEQFYWKCETSSINGKEDIETTLGESGIMTVTKLMPQVFTENFQLSNIAIPDIFINQLLELFIVSKYEEITIDIVEAEGIITPAFLKKVKSTNDETQFIVKIEFLDGTNFFEHIYFDEQKQITKRLLQHKNFFVIEKTTEEIISEIFPERIDYFNKGKILEENKI